MSSPQSQPQITQQPLKSSTNQQSQQPSSLSTHIQRLSPQQIDKKLYGDRPRTSEMVFFEIMDQVDGYDRLLKEMNELYTEGMLSIANVKFVNPYSSLSTKGYKPSPAVTKVVLGGNKELMNNKETIETNERPKQQIVQKPSSFKLITQTKDIKFTNSVIDSIHAQNKLHHQQPQLPHNQQNPPQQQQSQAQSHSAHSSQSTANQLYSYDEEELIIQEEEIVEECRKLMQTDNFSKEEFVLGRFNIQSQKEIVVQGMNKFGLLLDKLLQVADKKYQAMKMFDSIEKRYSNQEKQLKSNQIKSNDIQ